MAAENINPSDMLCLFFYTYPHRDIRSLCHPVLFNAAVTDLYIVQIGSRLIDPPGFQNTKLSIFVLPPIRIQLSPSPSKVTGTVISSRINAVQP